MFNQEMIHWDSGSVEERFASLVGGARDLALLVAVQEAGAVLALAQEDTAIEAQDVLSQADEALVMG